LQSKPLALELIPLFRQTGRFPRNRRLKTQSIPKWRSLLRPKPENTVIGGERLNAVPKHLPRTVGQGKIKVGFTVQSRVLPDDLHADGAKKSAVRSLNNLKFSQTLL